VKPVEALGAPARVVVLKVVRTTYRLEWEYDGHRYGAEGAEPERRRTICSYFNRPASYRAAAIRLIFSRRDKFAMDHDGIRPTGCRLCDVAPHDEQCRYHGGAEFDELVKRLSSWLMWRDGRRAVAGGTQ
jgi:hypothetical protein